MLTQNEAIQRLVAMETSVAAMQKSVQKARNRLHHNEDPRAVKDDLLDAGAKVTTLQLQLGSFINQAEKEDEQRPSGHKGLTDSNH